MSAPGDATILLSIEDLPPDEQLMEGSNIWAHHLARALRSRTQLVEYVTRPGGSRRLEPVARFLSVRAAARRCAVRGGRPRAAIYIPAARMVTTWALHRARYLRSLIGAPVAMMAFHEGLPASAQAWSPDLLL